MLRPLGHIGQSISAASRLLWEVDLQTSCCSNGVIVHLIINNTFDFCCSDHCDVSLWPQWALNKGRRSGSERRLRHSSSSSSATEMISHQLHRVPPVSFSQGLVHEAFPATSAVLWQLCDTVNQTVRTDQCSSCSVCKGSTCMFTPPVKELQHRITFDEVNDLDLYGSFLQVLDHYVGDSGQMTHVASPGSSLCPEIYRILLSTLR